MGFADVHAFNDIKDLFFIKKDIPKGKVRNGGGSWEGAVRGNERALICKKVVEEGTFFFSICYKDSIIDDRRYNRGNIFIYEFLKRRPVGFSTRLWIRDFFTK